ncbi:MAG: sensor histidine kinase [Opitutales bacterium]
MRPNHPRLRSWGLIAALLAVQTLILMPGAWQARAALREDHLAQQMAALEALARLEMSARVNQTTTARGADLALRRAVEHAARLEGLVGVELLGTEGDWLLALPASLALQKDRSPLPREAEARFHRAADLGALFPGAVAEGTLAPLVEVAFPLRPGPEVPPHFVRFWLDGEEAALAFARIDRQLLFLGTLTILIGALVLTLLGRLYSRSLRQVNRRLEAHAEALARSHRELLMKSKMSALGALSGHLVHELKNQISTLSVFTRKCEAGLRDGTVEGLALEDAELARDAVHRVRHLVFEVGDMLRQERQPLAGEYTWADLREILEDKLAPLATAQSVELATGEAPEGSVEVVEAHRLLLILQHLGQNAVQATPPGGRVEVSFTADAEAVRIRVADAGEGLPLARQRDLLGAEGSSKFDGWGIALSLCAQLARESGSRLELESTSSAGSVFCLTHPLLAVPRRSLSHPTNSEVFPQPELT